jgi:putative chitinase
MIISIEQLCRLFPKTSQAKLAQYINPLNQVLARFNINQPYRVRAFLSQLGHECCEFNTFEENLNYSAQGLLKTFPKYFTPAQANQYARRPQAIANRVYANRLGNGPESSGDGWLYRGRGGIQLTGKANYAAFASYMQMSLAQVVQYMSTPEGQMMASGWFWDRNQLNRWADGQDILTITKKINGGTNGYDDRVRLWNLSKNIFVNLGTNQPPAQPVAASGHVYKTCNVPALNVRQGPSTTATVVAQLGQGMRVLVISTTGDWSQIQLEGLVTGFVATKYLV